MKMDRRTFVYNAALGTLHVGLGGLGAGVVRTQSPSALDSLKIALHAPDFTPSTLAMPGLFPGRVIEVFNPAAIRRPAISEPAVRAMLAQGMASLTGDRGEARGRDRVPGRRSRSRSTRRVRRRR